MAAAERPPEIQKIRLVRIPGICVAPDYIAEELLRLEGFAEVEYVKMDHSGGAEMLFANRADVAGTIPTDGLRDIDAGKPLVVLSGTHGGCYELFANDRIRALRDLKGKRVAVTVIGSPEYYFIAAMMAYVGVDARNDLDWVLGETFTGTMRLFVEGRADAFLAGHLNRRATCQNQPGHPRHRAGPSVGTILLLHDCRSPRFREQVSRGHQAGGSSHS
jgi:NitT/TauT family transport system substrate-binding protein